LEGTGTGNSKKAKKPPNLKLISTEELIKVIPGERLVVDRTYSPQTVLKAREFVIRLGFLSPIAFPFSTGH